MNQRGLFSQKYGANQAGFWAVGRQSDRTSPLLSSADNCHCSSSRFCRLHKAPVAAHAAIPVHHGITV
jgi:hypothetical protein